MSNQSPNPNRRKKSEFEENALSRVNLSRAEGEGPPSRSEITQARGNMAETHRCARRGAEVERVIPRLAKRAEGPPKRSIASAQQRAYSVRVRLMCRGSANLQLRGPSPSARLGMTRFADVSEAPTSSSSRAEIQRTGCNTCARKRRRSRACHPEAGEARRGTSQALNRFRATTGVFRQGAPEVSR